MPILKIVKSAFSKEKFQTSRIPSQRLNKFEKATNLN